MPVKVDEPEGVGVVDAAPEIVVAERDDLWVVVVEAEVVMEVLPRLVLAVLRLMPAAIALLILLSKAIVPGNDYSPKDLPTSCDHNCVCFHSPLPLFLVFQCLVRLVDLHELLLRILFLALVGVVDQGELLEGLSDFLVRRILPDSENVIIIFTAVSNK